jgi:hypothetical protein
MGRNHAIFGGNWVLKTKQTNIKQCFGKAFCLSLSLSLSLHLFDLTIGFFDHFLFPPNCIGLSKLNPLLPKLKKARPDSLLIGNFEFIFIGFFFFFLSRLNASDYIPNLNYLLKFTPRYWRNAWALNSLSPRRKKLFISNEIDTIYFMVMI